VQSVYAFKTCKSSYACACPCACVSTTKSSTVNKLVNKLELVINKLKLVRKLDHKICGVTVNMNKEDFLETCVVLGALDRDSILKTILREKFNFVTNAKDVVEEELPRGLELLLHNPSPDKFADYAFALCSLEDNKETIMRHLLSIHFEAAVQSAVNTLRGPRVRTRQSKHKAEEELPGPCRKKSFVAPSTELPSKLNLFTDDNLRVMTSMSDIIPRFFPGLVPWTTGIYRNGSTFVLVVVDVVDGRPRWRSAGVQNKLTWYATREDKDRQIFDKITSTDVVVHVVRKRNSEMRYMGKCQKTEKVDRQEGSCVMYVA